MSVAQAATGAGGRPARGPARELTRLFRLPPGLADEQVLHALRAAGYAAGTPAESRSSELYLDTHDGRLARQGLCLRRRRTVRRWELLDRGALLVGRRGGAAAPPAGEMTERIAAVVGARRLLPVLEARIVSRVVFRGRGGLEVALQRWELADPHRRRPPLSVRLLAVRGKGPGVRASAGIAATLPVLLGATEVDDVVAVGLAALDLPVPGAPPPASLQLAATDVPAEVVRKVLGRQVHALRVNLDGAVLDLDVEFVHDMRVATRRSRAAVRLFAAVLDPAWASRMREELAWAAGELGAVRDLDVLLARLSAQLSRAGIAAEAAGRVLGPLEARRREARGALVAALGSARFAALLDSLADPATIGGEEAPALEWGARLVDAAARRFRKWRRRQAEGLAPEELHRLRIAFKRLRYTCEFFATLLGDEAQEAIRELVRFQDILGRHQDAVMAGRVLAELAAAVAPRDAGRLVELGALMQVQREEAAAERAAFAAAWPALPKRLSRLRRSLHALSS